VFSGGVVFRPLHFSRQTIGEEIPPRIDIKADSKNYIRFKREAFRGSEFAPRVLADEGIPVIMKVFYLKFSANKGSLLKQV